MAYTYPDDTVIPTTGFTNSNWKLNRAVSVSTSPFTGESQTYEYDKAIWSATVSLPPMRRDVAALWQAFFMKLHGRAGSFLLGDPDAKTAQGSITGDVTVTNAKAIGIDAIILTVAASNNGTVVFKAGDYVQFGTQGNSRLYMIVDNATASGSRVTINIEPPLKLAISAGATVDYTAPQCVMRMDNNDLGWDANHISTYGISFSCTEVS
tara:strand:+ start:788 stop:1414 length:627 start_codon:yes stop_codon:yes gene_type:complete